MKDVMQWGCVFAVVAVTVVANAQQVRNPGQQVSDPGQHFRAKQILGFKVLIEGERSVGTVEDIVMDDHGNVDYLIVTNSENQLVTVPWDAVRFHPRKGLAVVSISHENYQKAPTYTDAQYPAYSMPGYRTQVYQHYGLPPTQERRVIRRTLSP